MATNLTDSLQETSRKRNTNYHQSARGSSIASAYFLFLAVVFDNRTI